MFSSFSGKSWLKLVYWFPTYGIDKAWLCVQSGGGGSGAPDSTVEVRLPDAFHF